MDSKMKSLNEFTMSHNEIESTKGGHYYGHGVYWSAERSPDYAFGTGSIGTYVDGFSMGTDGHED